MRVWHAIGVGAVVVLMVDFFAWLFWGVAWMVYVGALDLRPSESPAYWMDVSNWLGAINAVAFVVAWLSPSSRYFERVKS